MLLVLSLATAVLSALLDNVTVVLLVVPVTLMIAKELELPAYPFLFAEVFASNIGGAATLIGDPPNILIGSRAGLGFDAFVVHVTPVVAVVLTVELVITHVLWGRKMRAAPSAEARLMAMDERNAIQDPRLLVHSVAVLAAVLAAFVFAAQLRLRPGTIAMFGAAVLLTPCLGGNATLVGASANLTVAGLAERAGVPFRFWTYAGYAVPMTIVSLAICHVYLCLRYF